MESDVLTLGKVEKTLLIPLRGRAYATEHFPGVLRDETALMLYRKLAPEDRGFRPYMLLASAARAANFDRIARGFLARHPDGVVVQLGCGLETMACRVSEGKSWYAVDLPEVMALRAKWMPEVPREVALSGDAFADDWLRRVRDEHPEAPLLVLAAGLLHYFSDAKVRSLVQMLLADGRVTFAFDAVSRFGMRQLRRRYMREMGHADAEMFFFLEDAEAWLRPMGGKLLLEEAAYRHIPKAGLPISARIGMAVSDAGRMVKTVVIACGGGAKAEKEAAV